MRRALSTPQQHVLWLLRKRWGLATPSAIRELEESSNNITLQGSFVSSQNAIRTFIAVISSMARLIMV